MAIALQTIPYFDNSGGLNTKYSPTKVPEDEASLSLNIDYSVDGAFLTRNGTNILNIAGAPPIPTQMDQLKTLLMFDYKKSDGTSLQIETVGTTIKSGLVTPVSLVTGLSALLPYPDMESFTTNDDEYLVWGNGVDENLKFDGTIWTNLSLPRPTPPTFAANGVGVLPSGTYNYYVSFVRTVGGIIVQESELSLVASHTIVGPVSINLVVPVCTETLLPGVTAQCNGRVIYRENITTGDIVRLTAGVTIADNVTTAYNDNILDANLANNIFADFNYQAAPKSKVFEASGFRMIYVDAASQTDVYASQANKPWNVIISSLELFDGPVKCLKRVFNALMIGTDRSIWVNNGDFATVESRRVSSAIGILNNRCAVEQDNGVLAILSTNKKYFTLTATDFSQNEIRFTDPLSLKIDPIFQTINSSDPEVPCMESYTAPSINKVIISVPIGGTTNNTLIIYNDAQAILKGKPCWQIWDNIKASALRQMTISSQISLYSGDYNGFLWNLDNSTINGDGAEENGTATSGSTTTIVDTTRVGPTAWIANSFVGMVVRGIGGTGIDQASTIISNTTNTLTFSAVPVAFDATSQYTIGGYDVHHYSNWKAVVSGYDFLKQLWFIWVNANASGDYPVQLILQLDFDQTTSNQINIDLNLAALNAIWGGFLWGAAIWGAFSVFQDRVRQFSRFRAIRLGFATREAGRFFQINGFSLSVQNKNLFFRST